jgi:predicted alpha/beta-hydrolase family hydrolase
MKFVETKSDTLDVLLHGSSGGMNYSLMQKIFDGCVTEGHSVVSFNFPFFERGEEHSSGSELTEELGILKDILAKCHAEKYESVRLIGKSLGGIIGARFLEGLSGEDQKKFTIIFFGYDVGDVNLKNFQGKAVVIQGEKDKYGNIDAVKKNLEGETSKDVVYYEVPNADHSFRNEQKEPVYEDVAINFFRMLQ